jgi:hypothetical protein
VDFLIYDGDACQHVYWTAIFQDPTLFAGDLLTGFISTPVFDPLGYQIVYRVGTLFADPLPFSQGLSLVLLLLSVWLLDLVSRQLIVDRRGRLVCLILFVLFSVYDASGGFPRSFAFPLLLAVLYLLQRDAFLASVAVLIPIVLFYPPLVLNVLALLGWTHLWRWWQGERGRLWWGQSLWLGLVTVAAFLFLLSVYDGDQIAAYGPKITFEEAKGMPEFYPGGRTTFFRDTVWGYLLVAPSGVSIHRLIGFALMLVVLGVTLGWRTLRMPKPAWHLTWTSMVLFTLAHLVLFALHHPSRYTLYTLPLAFILTIGANVPGFMDLLGTWWRKPGTWRGKVAPGWLGWSFLLVFFLWYPYVQGHFFSRLDMAVADAPQLELTRFLGTLPKDALVAGHPVDMNPVPLLARRKVLANHELSLPYYKGYYGQIRQRLFDFFEAYYAGSFDTVAAFVDRYGIDALVVRKDHYTKEFLSGPVYFEPYNERAKNYLARQSSFVLRDPPLDRRCYENELYLVLCFERS